MILAMEQLQTIKKEEEEKKTAYIKSSIMIVKSGRFKKLTISTQHDLWEY